MPTDQRASRFGATVKDWLATVDVYKQIIGHISDMIIVLNAEGQLAFAASNHDKLAAPRNSTEWFQDIKSDHQLLVRTGIVNILCNRTPQILQYPFRNKFGEWIWLESNGFPIVHLESGKDYVMFIAKDITKQKAQEEALRQMAFHDALTGLPNRRLFHEQFTRFIAQSKRHGDLLAVLSLDIDDFKVINDTMGHQTGDLFLQAFTERLLECLREIDILARIGGDEFMILLPAIDTLQSAEKVSERILGAFKSPFEIGGYTFYASVSLGIAFYPTDGKEEECLLKNADAALYKAKHNAGNGYKFFRAD